MPDIRIEWDKDRAVGDWVFGLGDIQTAFGIESAVYVSLFTDRLANPDYKPTDGTNDRRGWWGDTYRDSLIGSRLWQLDRAKRVGQQPLLLQARDYCQEALAWLIEDGLASKVEVNTAWLSRDALSIAITLTLPDGSKSDELRFRYSSTAGS